MSIIRLGSSWLQVQVYKPLFPAFFSQFLDNTCSYTIRGLCIFSVWPIWAFINNSKHRHLEFLLLIPMVKNHFLPSSGISRHSNDVMCKQPIADWTRMQGVIIVILCALYCNVFSPVNETWGNLTVLNSVLSQCRVSSFRCLSSGLPVHVHVFWRRRGFGDWFAGRMRSYAFKASLLLLAPPKSATLPLTGRLHDTGFN